MTTVPLFMKRERDAARQQRRDRVPLFDPVRLGWGVAGAEAARDGNGDQPVGEREMPLQSVEVSPQAPSEDLEETSPVLNADSKSEEDSPEFRTARLSASTPTWSQTSEGDQAADHSTEPSISPETAAQRGKFINPSVISPEAAAQAFLDLFDDDHRDPKVLASPRPQALDNPDIPLLDLENPVPPLRVTPRWARGPSEDADR